MAERGESPDDLLVSERETRNRYRSLLSDLQEHREEPANPESDELHEMLVETNELFAPVQRACEASLDSQAMQILANIGRRKAQNLQTEFVRFQPTEFAAKLVQFVGGSSSEGTRISAQGWAKLGEASMQYFKKSPPFQYMFGAFERGPKMVKERQQRQPKEKDSIAGKETVPTKLKNFDDNDQNEATSEEVERVCKILRDLYRRADGRPIDYFEFVLNPDSFGHTVENIFHVSFLVKDGLAEVFLDDDKLPVIRPVDKVADGTQQGQCRQQMIISISPKEWRELVQSFEVTSATIPPRHSLQSKG